MRQAKQTLKELMAGLAVWGGFVFVILMIVSRHRLAVACGLLTGLGTAVWLIWHMYRHLDIALELQGGSLYVCPQMGHALFC